MNKFTKLLSVFVIAGAVSAGVAGLAGCGEKPHEHNGTLHEAVAATCTTDGNVAYYTCDGADCAGKYFEDEACTKEITDIVIPATGHTEVYTDKGNGTHGITCEHGDLTETVEAHADEDHDGKCDDCDAEVAGTYVAEVAATCTTEGTAAHYIKGDGSDGKYYSDVNCTTEVTAESLVIAKLPHAYEYTPDATNAQHSYACEDCDDAGKADCVDEDKDGKCDICGGDVSFLTATAIPVGSYYNSTYQYEIIVAANGTVSYNYYGSAMANVSVTEFEINAETGRPTATLSYENWGYSNEKTVEIVRGGITLDGVSLPLMPEVIAEDKDSFAGIYTGELVKPADNNGNVVKITEFAISADGGIVYTQETTDKDGNVSTVSTYIDGSYYDVNYNVYKIGDRIFTALEVDANGKVTKIELSDEGTTATFTVSTSGFEIPTLPVEDYTLYKDAEGTNSLVIKNYSEQATYTITLNSNKYLTVLKGDATNGYVAYYYEYDENWNRIEKNIVLKFNADSSEVELLATDGTSIATLAIAAEEYPTLVVDGETENNNAVTDPFNTSYAYYEVETTGWYKITAGDNNVTIYTSVTDHVIDYSSSVSIKAGKTKVVYLTADQLIAVSNYYKTYGFTATYSETEPEPEYASFTDGKYEIASFDGSETYYVKGSVENAGKYYVSVTCTEWEDRGAYFVIGDTKYGYSYANYNWSVAEGGLVYEATLEAGAEVKVKFGCDSEYLSLGTVTVYLETEEEYNARVNSGSEEEATDLFSEDQIGTYVYADGSNLTFEVAANEITMSGGQYGYGTYKPTITKSGDTYTLSYMGYKLVFSFNAEGNIAVTSDNIYDYNSFVAVKQSASGGEEEGNTVVEKDTQYSKTADSDGYIIVDFKTPGTYKLTYDTSSAFSATVGETTVANGGEFTVADGATVTIKIKSMSGLTVSFKIVTVSSGSGSEEATKIEFTTAQQGVYTYSYEAYGGMYTEHVYYIIGSDYVILSTSYGNIDFEVVSEEEGVYTLSYDYYGYTYNITFSFNGSGNLAVVSDEYNELSNVEAVKSTLDTLSIGDNSIDPDTGNSYIGLATFTATEAGSYTFTFANLYENGEGTFVNGKYVVIDDTDGSATITVELAAGQTIIMIVDEPYDGSVSVNVTKSGSTGSSEEETSDRFTAAQQGTYVYEYEALGRTETITIIVTANEVNMPDFMGNNYLTFVSYDETTGTYVYSDDNDMTITFSFDNGNISVSEDELNNFYSGYTAEKQASESAD